MPYPVPPAPLAAGDLTDYKYRQAVTSADGRYALEDLGSDPDSLTLEAYDDHNYGPALVERLSPSRYFLVEGINDLARAKLFRSSTGLEGLLDATISIVEGIDYFSGSRVGMCRSANHRLTFSR